jgi:hypothetical protein
MNILPFGRQVEIISALTECVSIRAAERLTNAHRDTIMRLGVRVGMGCDKLHNVLMRGIHVPRLELDEGWSFVGKKQKLVTADEGVAKGDQYVFIALAGAAKAIVCYRVGKRICASACTGDHHGWLSSLSQGGRRGLWDRLHIRDH